MQISALECASLRTPKEREPQQKDYITRLNEIKNLHFVFQFSSLKTDSVHFNEC